MDLDLFKKIVDEAISSGTIHFSGYGEPLLHPEIKEMFAYARKNGFEIGLWTSGLKLIERLSEEILEKGYLDYIIFSLDALTPETYVKIKGLNAYDKVMVNISRFVELKKKKVAELEKDVDGWWGRVKPIVGVQILKMKENDTEIEGFMERWDFQDKLKKMLGWKEKMKKIEDQLKPLMEELDKVKDRLNWRKESPKGESGEAKKPEEIKEVELKLEKKRAELMKPLDKLYWETFYDKFPPVEYAIIGHFNNFCGQIEDRSVIDVTPLKRFFCRQLNTGVSILWNGDVVLCSQDFDGRCLLGNIKDQGLLEILDGERLREILQAHKNEKYDSLPLCTNCKEWYYNPYE
jgi:radical SAM protein with 4Fe4S-binding SPASM domain